MLLDSPAEMRKQYYVGERKSRCSLSRTPLPKLKGDFLKQKSGSRGQKPRSPPVLETSVPRFGLGDRDSAPSFLLISGGLAGPLTLPEFCDRAVFPVSEQRMSQAEHHSEALTLPLNPNRRLGKLGVVGRLSSGRPHFQQHGDCSSFLPPPRFPSQHPRSPPLALGSSGGKCAVDRPMCGHGKPKMLPGSRSLWDSDGRRGLRRLPCLSFPAFPISASLFHALLGFLICETEVLGASPSSGRCGASPGEFLRGAGPWPWPPPPLRPCVAVCSGLERREDTHVCGTEWID